MKDFNRRLAEAMDSEEIHGTWLDKRRKLELSEYLGLFLFGLFNPVVRTMRGLCKVSKLNRVQEEICGREVSLGSFSEAQQVVDTKLLEKVFEGLFEEAKGKAVPGLPANCQVVDSTLWHVLPRMDWALWRHQNTSQNAVRLHLCFNMADDCPQQAAVTKAKVCERKGWQGFWKPGDVFVGDRNYGKDFSLFSKLDEKECFFVLRIMDSATLTVLEELEVADEDRRAGVARQAIVRLGSRASYHSMPVRVVWVQTPKEILLLATNYPLEKLCAELVSELYRRRWQIELFFRWIKCILNCRHWLAESSQGVTIQIYLALIAALLLQLHTGIRPSKRMMELIQFHQLGYATDDELFAGIQEELAKAKNKKLKQKI